MSSTRRIRRDLMMNVLVMVAGVIFVITGGVRAEEAVRFIEGPRMKMADHGVEISFTVSRVIDVLVRILDTKGKVVRHLACGVLGKNPPLPFQKETLKQKLIWDGKDDMGKPVAGKVHVRVDAGVKPTFGNFIGWDAEGLLGSAVHSLDVDEEGNVYVCANLGGNQQDIDIMVFDREGKYQRTMAPFNPNLPEGKSWHSLIEARPGVMVPRTRFFPSRTFYTMWRGDAKRLRYISNGKFCVAWSDESQTHILDKYGMIVSDDSQTPILDIYGRMVEDWTSFGHQIFAVGPSGALYQVEGNMYRDKLRVTIKKVDLKTGKLLHDFVYAGGEKLLNPRFYLGTRTDNGEVDLNEKLNPGKKDNLRKDVKVAGEDEASFKSISDLAADSEGNIIVADAGKGAVKVYRKDGYFLTEFSTYTQGEEKLPLGNIRQLAVSKKDGSLYVVIPGANKHSSRLVKFDGFEKQQTIWIKEIEVFTARQWSDVCALTVDSRAEPQLIWMGHKQGRWAALSRIPDLGDQPGEVKVIGVGRPEALRRPTALAADRDGNLFVYDMTRGKYLRLSKTEGGEWKTVAFDITKGSRPGWVGGLSKTLYVDQLRGHVYAAHPVRGKKGEKDRWFLFRWDSEGRPVPFTATGENTIRLRGVTRGIAVDRAGNIYLTTLTHRQMAKKIPPLYKMNKEQIQEALGSVESEGPFPQIRYSKVGWGHVDVYAPDGSLKKKSLASVYGPTGVGVDSRGAIYVMDTFYDIDFGKMERAGVLKTNSDTGFLAKFPPSGGWRGRDEVWVHEKVSPVTGVHCGCNTGYMTVDLADRIFVMDTARFQVKVLDTSGNIITYIGTYGNRDCGGPKSRYPRPEIPFRSPTGVAVVGDEVYVSDDLNKRIVRSVLEYMASSQVEITF